MARFKFSKVSQHNGASVDIFYNRILKITRQCEFPDMNDRIIDAIIFGTNCIKAQDKLLQTPKTLTLQQCLSVVRHYESLKLHIQQIRPVDYLRQCHSSKKKGSGQTQSSSFNANNQNQRGCSQSWSRKGTWNQGQGQTGTQSLSNSTKFLPGNKCIGCGRNRHADWLRECPAQGKSCNKCGRLHHFESVCGMVPTRINRSQSRPPGRLVNELNQNNCNSLMSFPRNSDHENSMNMVPKQVLDVVN